MSDIYFNNGHPSYPACLSAQLLVSGSTYAYGLGLGENQEMSTLMLYAKNEKLPTLV